MVELLATISHEFRGPLASIRGYANTLLRHEAQLSTEEQTDFLQAIVQGSDRLERIIARVLMLAQLEEQLLPLQFTHVNLALLLQEIVNTHMQQGSLLDQPVHALHLEILPGNTDPNEAKYEVWADRRYLRAVFNELIENARQALPMGGAISLLLSLDLPDAASQPSGMITVQVRDQGIGMAPEHLSAIFHPFYRVDTSLTRATDGLGIGLALCAGILARHGGTIQVVSAPGEGSTFSILLPVSARPGEEERT